MAIKQREMEEMERLKYEAAVLVCMHKTFKKMIG